MQAEKWNHASDCANECVWVEDCYADSGHGDHQRCTCGLSGLLAATAAGPVVIDREGIRGRLEAVGCWKCSLHGHRSPGNCCCPNASPTYRIIPPDDHEEANDGE